MSTITLNRTTRRTTSPGRAPLVLGNNELRHTVTDKICRRRRTNRPPPPWCGGPSSSISVSRPWPLGVMIVYLFVHGRRRLGRQQPGRLGLRDRQLRVLGRYRPRRNADLRDPLPVPSEVANGDQPVRRGDDDLRRHLCRGLFPGHSRRPRLGRLLALPLSRTRWLDVAATSAARSSGTCSRFRTYFTVSLLFWYMGLIPDLATLRDRANNRMRQIVYGVVQRSAGAARTEHWQRYERALPAAGRPRDAAGALGALGRFVRLRGLAACPAGTPRSSRPTSSRAPSSAASRWWCCSPFRRAGSSASKN